MSFSRFLRCAAVAVSLFSFHLHAQAQAPTPTPALTPAPTSTNPLLPVTAPAAKSPLSDKPSAPIPAAGPIMHGLRVFTVGHSFHAWVAPLLSEVVFMAGMPDHQMEVLSVGGSTVETCWKIPGVKDPTANPNFPRVNTAREALSAGRVDVLTLSPIWMPDPGIEKFATLALQGNPDIRVTVQEFWLPNDTYEPKYPLDVGKTPRVDHDAATIPELTKAYEPYNHDVEEYVQGINKKLGKDVILIVPVGKATLALRQKIIAGEAPGIKKQSELYRDPWGHPQPPLQILSVYCHYAVIYRRSPVGLPMPKQLQGPYANPQLNLLLQQLAWDAVTHHPMTGVTASP